jgi:hypothetical protein
MKLGIKEALRLKKDLNLEDMQDKDFITVLKNYIPVEEEYKLTECAVYFHKEELKLQFKHLAFAYNNEWLIGLIDTVDNQMELKLTELELTSLMKIIGDDDRFKDLKEYLQFVGKNRFKW